MFFRNSGGKQEYHQLPIRAYDEEVEGDYEAALHECAEQLHSFYVENHHGSPVIENASDEGTPTKANAEARAESAS